MYATTPRLQDGLCHNLYTDLRLELDYMFSGLIYSEFLFEGRSNAFQVAYGESLCPVELSSVINIFLEENMFWKLLISGVNKTKTSAQHLVYDISLINGAMLECHLVLVKQVDSTCRRHNPVYVPKEFDFTVLKSLGYRKSIDRGGYISPCKSTLVVEDHKTYAGQVQRYRRGGLVQYLMTVGTLMQRFGLTLEPYVKNKDSAEVEEVTHDKNAI